MSWGGGISKLTELSIPKTGRREAEVVTYQNISSIWGCPFTSGVQFLIYTHCFFPVLLKLLLCTLTPPNLVVNLTAIISRGTFQVGNYIIYTTLPFLKSIFYIFFRRYIQKQRNNFLKADGKFANDTLQSFTEKRKKLMGQVRSCYPQGKAPPPPACLAACD